MALKPELFLDVEGRSLGGWLRVNVQRSVERVCTQWGVITTRSWPGQEQQWWIRPGDKVKVRMDDQLICTGWIDSLSPTYDGNQHNIEIAGRGVACDLVDCSYIGPPYQWKNTDPKEIIRHVASQFDIEVAFDAPLDKPLDNFTIQQSETGWNAIDRILKLRQVFAYDQPDGSLLITQGSDDAIEYKLVQGENILSATAELDDKDRFSRYVVKGQQKGVKGDKTVDPQQAATSVGEVTDDSVRRDRPMMIVQSADTDSGDALDRARWEKQNRWGNARKATITVQGWFMPDGTTWPINRLCDVIDVWLGLDQRLAITATTFEAGAQGVRTILTLQPPEALIPEPPTKEPKAKAPGGKAKAGGEGNDLWRQIRADHMAGEERRKEVKR